MAEEQKVKLELTVNQLNLILAGLAKLPLEAVYETFTMIQQQANKQLGAPSGPLSDKVIQ